MEKSKESKRDKWEKMGLEMERQGYGGYMISVQYILE